MSSAPAPSPFAALDPCVHCGFCLPACPTYLATGDEADSPRGRIVLMRALERGDIAADDPALVQHLDACLGCRGCEPVCPSGVGYGRGLEAAREIVAGRRGIAPAARAILAVFAHKPLWKPLLDTAAWIRRSGIPAMNAGSGRMGFSLGMLASTAPADWRTGGPADRRTASNSTARPPDRPTASNATALLFSGCIMSTLYKHINAATRRVLEANGYRVIEPRGQACCGALHEHAGDRAGAGRLARKNLKALAGEADFIVVNSAGCGALLKDYGHLLGSDEAHALGARVRDVSELLAEAGPRTGAPLEMDVVYDAPCHLQHAQRVQEQPLQVLASIPGLRVRLLPGSDKCCGSAGIYSMLHPALARSVLDAKIRTFQDAVPRPAAVVTGNPGCHMQIGAGLRAAGLDIEMRHTVELLDESYRRAGFHD